MRNGRLEFLHQRMTHAALERVACAESLADRCRGLLGRPAPGADEGMLIQPCSSIHTLGMRYPIDVVWLDRDHTIRKLVDNLRPGRFSFCPGARAVLELGAGQIRRLALARGMQVKWSHDHAH